MSTNSENMSATMTRQLAKETLEILVPYTVQLMELSRDVGRLSRSSARASTTMNEARLHEAEFLKLIDGLQTFSDTLIGVKQALCIGISPSTELLEVELLSTLQDLLKARELNDHAYYRLILDEHLPEILGEWCIKGIPAFIENYGPKPEVDSSVVEPV